MEVVQLVECSQLVVRGEQTAVEHAEHDARGLAHFPRPVAQPRENELHNVGLLGRQVLQIPAASRLAHTVHEHQTRARVRSRVEVRKHRRQQTARVAAVRNDRHHALFGGSRDGPLRRLRVNTQIRTNNAAVDQTLPQGNGNPLQIILADGGPQGHRIQNCLHLPERAS